MYTRKKLLTLFTSCFILFSVALAFSGGSGTSSDPYEIDNCVELQKIENGSTGTLNDHYELVSNINCSNTRNWNFNGSIYKGFEPIGNGTGNPYHFSGTLDGNGNVIYGLYINRPGQNFIGVIGDNQGLIKHLGVRKVNITGGESVGGIAGYSRQGANISETFSSGVVSGKRDVGGIVGQSSSFSTYTNRSYSLADVEATKYNGGGIIGFRYEGYVAKSYSAGNVSAANNPGGVIGFSEFDTSLSSTNYWDIPSSQQNTSAESSIGFGSLSDPTPVDNMTGLDAKADMSELNFSSVWEAVTSSDSDTTSDGYPILQSLNRTEQLKAQGIYSSGTSSILKSQVNANVPKGALWVQGSDFRWGNGTHEFWLKDAPVVNSGSPGSPGALWVQGTKLHWIDENSDERSYKGGLVQSGVSGPNGALWVQNGYIHYIDQNSDERKTDGT